MVDQGRIAQVSEMTPAAIKDIRRNVLRLTREQFAQLLGVTALTVGRWERGETRPSAYQVGLLQAFRTAGVRNANMATELKVVMVTAGVIAALYLLLKMAQEE